MVKTVTLLCALGSSLLLAGAALADGIQLRPLGGQFRAGASDNTLQIHLVNDVDLQGLQFELSFNPALGQPTAVNALERVAGPLQIRTAAFPGVLRVLVYDPGPARAAIAAGEDAVVSVSFAVPDAPAAYALNISLRDALAADGDLVPRPIAPASVAIPVTRAGIPGEGPDRDVPAAGLVPASGPLTRFALHREGPNPFSSSTSVRFDVPRRASVRIAVYDVGGRLVRVLRDGAAGIGTHVVHWDGTAADGSRAGPGLFFVRMSAEHVVHQLKVIALQ